MRVLFFCSYLCCCAWMSEAFSLSRDSVWVASEGEYIPLYEDEVIARRLRQTEKVIPLPFNAKVRSFIRYYTVKNRDYLRKVQELETVYFPIFEEALRRHGMPEELKYLAVVESGLRSGAISRTGAVGLWQFMPATGRLMGLKQDMYVDERRDTYKATDAACRYLQQLHREFGDWTLAMAAYNSGAGRVRRAIRRSRRRNFWQLYRYLPRETRAYVPQFVAVTYAMENHVWHNLYPERRLYHLPHFTINTPLPVDIKVLASALDLCVEPMLLLNPKYVHGILPASSGRGYEIRIPLERASSLETAQPMDSLLSVPARMGKERLIAIRRAYRNRSTYGKKRIVYRVRWGDAISVIARRYGVRQRDIRKWNRLRSRHHIRSGQRLVLWVRPSVYDRHYGKRSLKPRVRVSKKTTKTATFTGGNGSYYVVQPGDSLWDISNKYAHLSVRKLKRMNRLRSSRIHPGQRLLVK